MEISAAAEAWHRETQKKGRAFLVGLSTARRHEARKRYTPIKRSWRRRLKAFLGRVRVTGGLSIPNLRGFDSLRALQTRMKR